MTEEAMESECFGGDYKVAQTEGSKIAFHSLANTKVSSVFKYTAHFYCPVGKIGKKQECVFVNSALKYDAILSKIHSYRLLFWRF